MTLFVGSVSGRSPARITSLSTFALLAAVFILGWGFVEFAGPGSHVAAWWPAAGVSCLLVLRLRRQDRLFGLLAIVVVTALSNVIGGRGALVALCFAVANAAEVWLLVLIVTRAGQVRPVLDSLATAFRFCIAVVAGAVLIGGLAGITVGVFDGGNPLTTWVSVAAAHATAVLIIVPFALVPRDRLANAKPIEVIAQIATLAGVILFVFGPGQSLPLAFLPIPFIAWAAFRFEIRIVLLEIVGLALSVSWLTSLSGGPFAAAVTSGGDPSTLIQIFLLSLTSFVLLASSAQHERRLLTSRLASREEILRGGFAESQVGLLIVERVQGEFAVLESNDIAIQAIGGELTTVAGGEGELILWRGPLADSVRRALFRKLDRVTWSPPGDDEYTVFEVLIARLEHTRDDRYSIQFVDVSAARRTDEAQRLALHKEQEASSRLIELNRQKDDFVASASHELRTPITSILGYVEMLEEDADNLNSLQRRSVDTIARNARRLAALVESLLELGTPDGDRPPPAGASMDQVIRDVVNTMAPLAKSNSVRVTHTRDGDDVFAAIPAVDLERIVTNLVSNAVKFTREGGQVAVGASEENGVVTLTVQDTGDGMSPEVLDHIFERFYRAPEAENRRITGTGLGLPLVNGLVGKNSGTIDVASTPGVGTTVSVTLPRAIMS